MCHKNGTKHLQKLALANKREADKQFKNALRSIMKFFGAPANHTAVWPSTSSSQIASNADLPTNNEIKALDPVQMLNPSHNSTPNQTSSLISRLLKYQLPLL